ncbi:hypothetical protein IKE67_09485 [bacterium]|nr:hypothetical protein [bacterium]
MKKLKISIIILSTLIVLYLGFIFAVSLFLNSDNFIKILNNFIKTQYDMHSDISGLKVELSPLLSVKITANDIIIKDNNKVGLNIENLNTSIKRLELKNLNADLVYANLDILKKLKSEKKKDTKKKKSFDINKIPYTNIKKIEIVRHEGENLSISSNQFVIKENNGIKNLDIIVNIKLDRVLHPILIGEVGSLYIDNKRLVAKNFPLAVGKTRVVIDGSILNNKKLDNFTIKGNKIPVKETLGTVLFLQKYTEHERKFIENFTDFKGTADVDLVYKDNDLSGVVTANDLFAKFLPFYVPVSCKKAEFFIKNGEVRSFAVGTFGTEKLTHELLIKEMYDRQKKEVFGKVNSKITTALTKKYLPSNIKVKNYLDMEVDYYIKQKKPNAKYYINIPADSGIMFNDFYAGIRNKNKKIFAETQKIDKEFFLKDYRFSVQENNEFKDILFGNGYFKIIDGKMTPQYITLNTNGYVPTSFVGSFKQQILGGEFKGDLKYDFKNNQVFGTFDIIKARHKDFHIAQAHVVSGNGVFNITSNGLYKGEKYTAELSAKNDIYGNTLIYNMKLFLDKLVFETTPDRDKSGGKLDSNKFSKKVKNIPLTINNWEIVINEIRREAFVLKNAKLVGSLKNHIFNFNMKDLNFADGTVHAKGVYDFAKDTSNMTFEAKNIDSNKVAEMTLNLQNQIDGIASAKVELKAKDMFRFLDARCAFEVKEGFLPKLGDKELLIKNSKYKISDIVNIDLSQKDLMKDDIKGTFEVHNTELKNINLTTWHELSAIFLEGSYEMEKQYADLQLFWHYSKEAPKGVRIFGIPLSTILKVVFRPEHSKGLYESKLLQIPKIKDNDKNSNYYRIHLKGDINKGKTNLELKEIR